MKLSSMCWQKSSVQLLAVGQKSPVLPVFSMELNTNGKARGTLANGSHEYRMMKNRGGGQKICNIRTIRYGLRIQRLGCAGFLMLNSLGGGNWSHPKIKLFKFFCVVS